VKNKSSASVVKKIKWGHPITFVRSAPNVQPERVAGEAVDHKAIAAVRNVSHGITEQVGSTSIVPLLLAVVAGKKKKKEKLPACRGEGSLAGPLKAHGYQNSSRR
jgi:hypothetical protein